jgi:antitoxin VapB
LATAIRRLTMSQTAKVITEGRRQAVQLPEGFRLPGDEVLIERVGDKIVLMPTRMSWEDFFARRSNVPDDFLADRRDPPPQIRELL